MQLPKHLVSQATLPHRPETSRGKDRPPGTPIAPLIGMLPVVYVAMSGTQIAISTHALALAVGVALGAARLRARPLALLCFSAAAPAALFGAHGLYAFLRGSHLPGWHGGLASVGGLVCGLLVVATVAVVTPSSFLGLLDPIAPAGLLALAVGRVGCFLAGCCYGAPTEAPWGVVFPEVDVRPRHPLQLYSAAADLLMVALLPSSPRWVGMVSCRAAQLFGLARILLECLRDPAETDFLYRGLTLPQACGIALVTLATVYPAAWRRMRLSTEPSSPRSTGTPSR